MSPRARQVPGSHITALYYTGFSYLMMRRYTDCIRTLNACLVYVNRNKQQLAKSSSFEQILKKQDQMVSLLAIAFTLCPSNKLLEDDVKGTLQEKLGEKMVKMQMGEEAVFDELFSYACPKFITPQLPSYDDPLANNSQDAYRLQLKMFLQEVRAPPLPTLSRRPCRPSPHSSWVHFNCPPARSPYPHADFRCADLLAPTLRAGPQRAVPPARAELPEALHCDPSREARGPDGGERGVAAAAADGDEAQDDAQGVARGRLGARRRVGRHR